MPYASFADVQVYVPDMTAADDGKVAVLLEQAEAAIELEFPDLHGRVSTGRTRLINVRRVEAEMVASVMRNPSGYASSSETIDALSNSRTINTKVASGLLQLTDEHRSLLRGGDRTGGAFTINGRAAARRSSRWP